MIMLDPLLSLALSVRSNPGVYALLRGSGVSRAAGVPTGWEVVLDPARDARATTPLPQAGAVERQILFFT